ncbi:MAG: DAK2 domain-containing protein [Deltaproteobacteria bacterium]|nr:DAK2 domain-containing protein [Deltaproteobacteria bacterium]
MTMLIGFLEFKAMLMMSAGLLRENEPELSKLDSIIGDGDHGIAMVKIAGIIEKYASDPAQQDITGTLTNLADDLMGLGIGSSGPLWGAFFEGMSEESDKISDKIDAAALKKLFTAACVNLADVSGAKIGDKTMMDAMIPAMNAMESCAGDIPQLLRAAAEAAKSGAAATVNYLARYGRAKNLGERVLGVKDPGAVSSSLFFEGLARYAESL